MQPTNGTKQSNRLANPSIEDMFQIIERNLVLVVLKGEDLLAVALGNNINIACRNVMLAIMGENITYNVEREGEGCLI